MTTTELHDLTLAEAAKAIESRELSPVDYTDALIARCEALDPQLNAFITSTFDLARDNARAAETEIAAGTYDERHEWTVDKTVTPLEQGGYPGDVLPWTWTVTAGMTTSFAPPGPSASTVSRTGG